MQGLGEGGENVDKSDFAILYCAIVTYDIMANSHGNDLIFTVSAVLNLSCLYFLMNCSIKNYLYFCGFLTILCFVLRFLLKV